MKLKTIKNSIIFICVLTIASLANAKQIIETEAVVYDDRFYNFFEKNNKLEILASDLEWAEGPVWVESLNALLFSDVATDKIYRWDQSNGLKTYLHPSGHEPDNAGHAWRGSNGLAIDNNGALLLAQQSNRRLSRMTSSVTDPKPQYELLSNQFKGNSLNSPNDLVVHPSGDVYFTDPPYGLAGREKSPDLELDFFGVYRLTKNNKLSVINRELEKPNGIALSNDKSTLYVSNSENGKSHIISIPLDSQGNAKTSRLFFDGSSLIPDGPGATDGMAVHRSDYLFVSIPNGIGILSPKGKLLGKVALGQVTNVAIDNSYSFLYITTPKRLLRLKIKK